MIYLWLIPLPIAILVYFLMRTASPRVLRIVAGVIWPGVPLILTIWILIVGDQMPSDAVLVDPATL